MIQAGTNWRSFAGALLLLPMLLSALIPQGFMPTTTDDGYISVSLCTTEGLRTVLLNAQGVEVDPADQPNVPRDQRQTTNHCLFASFVALGLPEHGELAKPIAKSSVEVSKLTDFLLALRGSHRPVGARAPPVSA
ncbi:conserved hypothetical protein [Roseibium sp. TrichSKD4]|uniref:DUF2946 family protein n=1 Tax=Roseibium sp. TrichSKD4 TaxID=744980 RepID=UPI0001E563BC|nr:conserved hypothetical protein [Roseibium sp. TrichSKD4]